MQHTDREGAKQIYHLSLLKVWKELVAVSLVTVDQERDELGPEVTRSNNQSAPLSGGHLSLNQKSDFAELQKRFADVFCPLPGRTSLIYHQVETTPCVSVRTRPYRLPEHKKKFVQAEIRAMLELGVIEESHSAWSSPIVLVGKPDGSIRFCVDYRKVNEVSRFWLPGLSRAVGVCGGGGVVLTSAAGESGRSWEIDRTAENQVISGNCLIGRLL